MIDKPETDSVDSLACSVPPAAALGRFTDTQRLDYLNKHPEAVLGLGTRWYYRSPRGHRRFYALRDALDAAMALAVPVPPPAAPDGPINARPNEQSGNQEPHP